MKRKKKEPITNITMSDKLDFDRHFQTSRGLCLFSCFYKKKPTVVICESFHDMKNGEYLFFPRYLKVTQEIADQLVDHDGRPCDKLPSPN